MNTKAHFLSTKSLICIGALATCAVVSGPIQAKDHAVTVSVAVSRAGLDLSNPAAARELYGRLSDAARVVCSHGNRVDLHPVSDFTGCYENSLAAAVRSVNEQQLTMEYLARHTLQDGARHGINTPVRMAAK